ncbi:MAG: NADH-quinone oxidoreductase subunit E [Alistipes sp.]|nr:NADH-quinone oxidoreductase subunit E [Alistipes sp.]
MLLYILLAAIAIIAAIFLTPLRQKVWVTTGIVATLAVAATTLAIKALIEGRIVLATFSTTLFGEESFAVDKLSALFLIIISIASITTVLYSRGYLKGYLERYAEAHISMHYTALTTLVASMMFVVMSSGGFSFLFAWELMTIASFILIPFEAERQNTRRSALNYLVMMHIGFIFLVIGFVMCANVTGSANFVAIVEYFKIAKPLPLFIILFIGFGMKAGLFPMHIWLPEAHPAAPSHISAIMSGVMIKTGVYGIMRLMQAIDHNIELLYTIGLIVLLSGIVTGLWGIILAAMQNDIKRLLAYSSIENVGVILIGLGIAAVGHAAGSGLIGMCGMCGALLHTVNHSLFKTILFLNAGNIYSKLHTTSMNEMGGLAKYMPITAIITLFGAVAICALPPLNGFISELLIYIGMFNGVSDGHEVLYSVAGIIALSLIGGIAVLVFTKLFGVVFLGSPRSHHVAESSEVDNLRIGAMAIPATLILFIGLFPQVAIRPIAIVAEAITGADKSIAVNHFEPTLKALSASIWVLIAVVLLLYALKHKLQSKRKIEEGPTWGCGFTAPNARMQYTGESFSEGLESIGRPLMKHTVDGRAVEKGEIFPLPHKYRVRHSDKVDSFLGQWWVQLMHRINQYVMRLRTGRVNNYITYALALFVLVLILSLVGIL